MPARAESAGSFLLNPYIWRDGRDDLHGKIDDVGFFRTLLDKLEAVLPIDHRRVFVTGFSNGGAMSFTLGAGLSNRIAAIAPVCTQSFVDAAELKRPLPVCYIVGTADPLIPFHGGSVTLTLGHHTRNAAGSGVDR